MSRLSSMPKICPRAMVPEEGVGKPQIWLWR